MATANQLPTFLGRDGMVTVPIFAQGAYAHALAVQPDGAIVAAGRAWNGEDYDFALARFLPDGSPDDSFAAEGTRQLAISQPGTTPGAADDVIESVAIMPDGRIVAVGTSAYVTRIGDVETVRDSVVVAIFPADGGPGSPIPWNLLSLPSDVDVQAMALQEVAQGDVRILVAGTARFAPDNHQFLLMRFDAQGGLDPTFGSSLPTDPPTRSGFVTTSFGSAGGLLAEASSLALQSTGDIVVAGRSFDGEDFDVALARYTPDGVLDNTFGVAGRVITANDAGDERAYSVVALDDDRLVIAGEAQTAAGGVDFLTRRYTEDGLPDTAFGSSGALVTSMFTQWDASARAVVQDDGTVVLAGYRPVAVPYDAVVADFALLGVTPGGSVDTGFANLGRTFTPIAADLAAPDALAVALDAQGRILVAGDSLNGNLYDFALARYTADGALDPSFGAHDANTTLDGAAVHAEGGLPVVLDGNVRVHDAELAQAGSYGGATLTLRRQGGANPDDHFVVRPGGGTYSLEQGSFLMHGYGGGGTVTTNRDGTLVLSFDEYATEAFVHAVMQDLAYVNASEAPPGAVTIEWTFSDGYTGAGGPGVATGSTIVTILPVNDAPTFADGPGKAQFAFASGSAYAQGAMALPDGSTLLAGALNLGVSGSQFMVGRIDATGVPDLGFGTDAGFVFPDAGTAEQFAGVGLQPDGRIVLLGTVYTPASSGRPASQDFALVRLDADGHLDTTFGTAGTGVVVSDFADPPTVTVSGDYALGLHVLDDGSMLATGWRSAVGKTSLVLARYHSDGRLDTEFGGDGWVLVSTGGSESGDATTVQPDGRILVCGTGRLAGNGGLLLARFEADGRPDASFGENGIVITAVGTAGADVEALALLDDGRILVAGQASNPGNRDIVLARYLPDGALDRTFGADGSGIVTTDLGGSNDSAISLEILPDGRICVGAKANDNDGSKYAVVRYLPDGSLDEGYGGLDGRAVRTLSAVNDSPGVIAFRDDGSALLAGSAFVVDRSVVHVGRLDPDGSFDREFGAASTLEDASTVVSGGNAVVLDDDVSVRDPELATSGSYAGSSLTLMRHGGASPQDNFSAAAGGSLGALAQGQPLVVGTETIGTVATNSAGTLRLQFGDGATAALVDAAMRQIAYSIDDESAPSTVTIDWTFDDGNAAVAGAQGAGGALQASGSTTVAVVLPVPHVGTAGDDTMSGTGSIDLIQGLAGDDLITGGAGDDRIDGGEGTDTAAYAGPASRYTLGFEADGRLVLTDTTGAEGTDTLSNVERLRFADKTVVVESAQPKQPYAGVPEGVYHFFIVAFDAAPGITYMDQLAEAWWYFEPLYHEQALSTIVEIFTRKPQFTDVYPESLGDRALAGELVSRIVKGSASDEAKAEAVTDIEASLGLGWSRGQVIYTVFGNLAAKPFDDPTWGGTARQFERQIEVARVYTEVLHQSTTHLPTLRDVLAPVTPDTDVSSEAAVVALIGQALLDGAGL